MEREYCESRCSKHILWPGTQGQLGHSLVTTALSGREGCSVLCPWVGCCTPAALADPTPCKFQVPPKADQTCFGSKFSSTESPCALSSQGILINEQQPNDDHNFQVGYGNLSGQHVKAFCLKTMLQVEKLPKKNFFLLERVVLCRFTLLVRSVAMARLLCAHQHPPALSIAFSFPPHARQSQGRTSG